MTRGGFKNVVFDCDSTLVKIEGIDRLGALAGKQAEISRITRLAMNGKLPFEKALQMRLDAIKPKRRHLETVGREYVASLVKDGRDVVAALHFLGRRVYIVAGGYDVPVRRLASVLGISPRRVRANTLFFDGRGNYRGLKPGPCARTTGKSFVLRRIAKTGPTLFVGDGATDAACRDAVDCFVGYGGVARRPRVLAMSEHYIFTESLAPVLALAAGDAGLAKLAKSRFRKIVLKGQRLIRDPRSVKLGKELEAKMIRRNAA